MGTSSSLLSGSELRNASRLLANALAEYEPVVWASRTWVPSLAFPATRDVAARGWKLVFRWHLLMRPCPFEAAMLADCSRISYSLQAATGRV